MSAPSQGGFFTATSGPSHPENTQLDKFHVFWIHSFPQIVSSKSCIFKPGNRHKMDTKQLEFAFEMNQLIKLKNLCHIFEFCFIFSLHIDIICLLSLPKPVPEPVSLGQGFV